MTSTTPTGESFLVRSTRPKRAFVVIALLFGTALVLIIPPFQSAEEPFHFLLAYQITKGVFVSRQVDARGRHRRFFSQSLQNLATVLAHRVSSGGEGFNSRHSPGAADSAG
jgi:hypothetical protein